MIQTKAGSPSRGEIVRATRAIHDGWTPQERVHRKQVAISRQRELLAKLLNFASPNDSR